MLVGRVLTREGSFFFSINDERRECTVQQYDMITSCECLLLTISFDGLIMMEMVVERRKSLLDGRTSQGLK